MEKGKGKVKKKGPLNKNLEGLSRAEVYGEGTGNVVSIYDLHDLVCCCCFVPFMVVLVGILFLSGENTRVERIEKYRYWVLITISYNKRAQIWKDSGLESFKNISFYLNGFESALSPVNSTSGKYYPVRDKCRKIGDPREGCVLTGAYYYKTTTTFPASSTSLTFSIYGPSKESISKTSYDSIQTTYYSVYELGCHDKRSECSSMCGSMGGSWSSSSRICTVTKYLNELCYRVREIDGKWQLDWYSP